MRLVAFLTFLALIGACQKAKPDQPALRDAQKKKGIATVWPPLPRSAEEGRQLIAKETQHAVGGSDPFSPSTKNIRRELERSPLAKLQIGDAAIRRWIQRWIDRSNKTAERGYLLWGTYHDSAQQIEAFRRLIGIDGLRGVDAVAIEQFDADGRWGGNAQDGDDALLHRYRATGDLNHLNQLRELQRENNYTAWKFGYVPTLMDLLFTLRARDIPFFPCDMPRATQSKIPRVGDNLMRLRELHCIYSLKRRKIARKGVTAMLWGQEHIRRHGISRYFASQVPILPIYVFGHRPARKSIEVDLAKTFGLNAPLLLPLNHAKGAVLFLAGPVLRAEMERKRDDTKQPNSKAITWTFDGEMSAKLELVHTTSESPYQEAQPAWGAYNYSVQCGGRKILGVLTITPTQSVHLNIDCDGQIVEITYRSEAAPQKPSLAQ